MFSDWFLWSARLVHRVSVWFLWTGTDWFLWSRKSSHGSKLVPMVSVRAARSSKQTRLVHRLVFISRKRFLRFQVGSHGCKIVLSTLKLSLKPRKVLKTFPQNRKHRELCENLKKEVRKVKCPPQAKKMGFLWFSKWFLWFSKKFLWFLDDFAWFLWFLVPMVFWSCESHW